MQVDDGGAQWVTQERPAGSFMRQLALGEGLDVAGIHASYENGVLTLTIPVSERSKPRKIQVQQLGRSGAQQVTAGPGGSGGADVSSQGAQDAGNRRRPPRSSRPRADARAVTGWLGSSSASQ